MKDYLNLSVIRSGISVALLSLCWTSITFAEPIPTVEDHFSIGAGAVHNTAPYEGYNGFTTPMPFFDIQYGRFFANNQHDEPVIGWELFRHKRVIFALAATKGRIFLDTDEINDDRKNLYLGLEDRDEAIEVGIIAQFYSRVGLVEGTVYHDVISAYGGTRSSLSLSRPFPETGNWVITPRVFIKHYSEKFNNYYYGVSKDDTKKGVALANAIGISEADYKKIRPSYTPGNSGHFGVDLSLEYNFSENIVGVGYIGIEKFSGEMETSPLIEDKELITSSLGLRYTF